jgi:hypothetical protein
MMLATVVPCWEEAVVAMSRSYRIALLALAGLTLCLPAPSTAQDSADPDTREVNGYALTESGLTKFAQATTNLGPIAEQIRDDCDDSDEAGNDQSLDGQAARISGIPAAAAAIESAGMPVREYVVFIWSMIQNGVAAWILTQPGGELPPGVSMANVDFYRAHEAELQRLAQQVQAGDCESANDDTEEDYPGEQDSPGEEHYDGEQD